MHGTRVKKWLAVTWIGALTFGLYGFGDGTPIESSHTIWTIGTADDSASEFSPVQPTDVYVCDADGGGGTCDDGSFPREPTVTDGHLRRA